MERQKNCKCLAEEAERQSERERDRERDREIEH